jgi:hypothetical protein
MYIKTSFLNININTLIKKILNHQRPYRKYWFNIVDNKKDLKIWWDSPFNQGYQQIEGYCGQAAQGELSVGRGLQGNQQVIETSLYNIDKRSAEACTEYGQASYSRINKLQAEAWRGLSAGDSGQAAQDSPAAGRGRQWYWRYEVLVDIGIRLHNINQLLVCTAQGHVDLVWNIINYQAVLGTSLSIVSY